MINIKDIQGNIILSVPITESAQKVEELMSNDYIQLSWNSDSSNSLPLGSYIEHEGERYSLIEPYTPSQKNEVEFVYTPQFKSRVMAWGKKPFFFYSGESREPDWTLTSNPADFMRCVCDAILEETGESWSYSIDASLPASASLSFTSVDILSGLNQIADAFETEWFAEKSTNTIYLGLLSHGEEVTLEVGKNINVPSVQGSKEGYYTRFYAFGSTRNITQDYEGSNTNNLVNKRLTLDPTKYPNGYKDVREGLSEGEIFSKVLIFDDVYPCANLSISGVRNRLMYRLDTNGDKIQVGTDEEGNPIYDQYAIWYFRIEGFDFDLSNIIKGYNLSVSFQSGALQGREFELKYYEKDTTITTSDGLKFEAKAGDYEILFVEEGSYIIPSMTGLVPSDGDGVILFNIKMPSEYTQSAYIQLEEELDKAIARMTSDLNNYTFKSNPVAFSENNPNLSIGRAINFVNGGYSYTTRVIKLTTHLDFPIEQEITIGNQKVKGNTQQLKEEVASANKDLNLLAVFNDMTQSIQQSYNRTQQMMLEGFAAIKNIWQLRETESGEKYAWSAFNVVTQQGITMYADNVTLDLPSIYAGLPVDNSSIYWEDVTDEEGNVIDRVLKAKIGSGEGGSATLLGDLENVGAWANVLAEEDRIMVQKKGASSWTSLSLEELGTASFENVKESGEGNAYTSIELSEDKKTLTLNKGESFAKQTDYEALNTKVTDFLEGSDTDGIINKWRELESFLSNMEQSDDLAEILSGKADKGTTLEDYGITDAYTKSEVDSALKDYVTIDGKETITGEKNFTGGLNVNGSPIVYDKDKKYWKLTGDLLVTGGVTMFANEGTYSPSTIMDAITTDNVNLKVVNGVLTFVGETGGGVADSVDWENIDGKPSWIDSVKPSYTFSEIGSKPTTLSGYGITDAKISNGVITLGGNAITPLTQENGDARYITAIGISGNYLTYTKNGATQNVTVPYATNADKLDGIHSTGFYKSNAGSLESDELETFVNRDSGGYSVTYRSASTGDVPYSGMFSVLKSGAGSVQAIELIANNYTLKQGALQVRLNVDGTRYSATKTIAFSDGNVATADTASKLSIVSKTAWGQTYWTSGGVPTNISGNMTGVGNITMSGSINSAITINSGDDSAWIKGSGHNMYFGGTGYGNQSYYFRPLYGASGATKSNLYIQNASASSSPTFTTTHSFLSNGNASHAGTLTINGIKLSKSKDDVLFIDANLVVRGAVTMYGTNSVTASTIMDGILVDDSTIIKDPTTKKLMINPDLELVGGLDETALANYLTTNKYLTQTTGDTRYVTALGIDSNNLTWTKNGVVNNIAVPYATTAKELTSYSAITFSKSDNSGKPCYLLIADVTSWYNVSSGATAYGVAGFVYGYRNGAWPAYSMNIAARCSYGKGYYSLNSSLKSIIEPMVVSYNSKYYLALYLQGSNRTFNFIGGKDNLLSSFTELQCSDGNGTYSGLSVVYKGSATGTSSKADSLSTSRTISISGHATGSGSFDGSSDLGINIAIPTRNVYINGTGYTVHSTITTDTTGVYAPTSGGTSGYVLKANGATSIPTWVAQSSLSVGTASKLSTVSKTAWGRTYWTSGGVPTSISGDMSDVGNVTSTTSNTYSLGSSSNLWKDVWASNVHAGAFSFVNGYKKSISSAGWYRFATSTVANDGGGTYMFFIRRSYTNSNNEAYIISCIVDHGKVHWSLLNGHANTRLITQVRCTYTNNSTIYFDLYYNGTVSNTVYVNAVGDCTLQVPTATSSTLTNTSTFGLGDGMIVDGNLLVKGGITMYATSSESPITDFYTSRLVLTETENSSAFNDKGIMFGAEGNARVGINSNNDVGIYVGRHIYLRPNSLSAASSVGMCLESTGNAYLSGGLTIGATSSNSNVVNNTYKLYVTGKAYVTGTLTQGSDIRYKDIHKDILLSLATMAEAPSIEFHFKDDEQKSTHIGTSAQYWQSVSGVVTEDSEGRLGMDYSSLGVVMGISLAKELSRFENDTDRRIRLLEEENKKLKEEIEQLKTA